MLHQLPGNNQHVIDWFSTAAVERILAEAGADMAVLIEVDPDA